MPLIKCVDCGKDISDRAQNCPHCGCPVTFSLEQTQEKAPVAPVEKPVAPVIPVAVPVEKPVQPAAPVEKPVAQPVPVMPPAPEPPAPIAPTPVPEEKPAAPVAPVPVPVERPVAPAPVPVEKPAAEPFPPMPVVVPVPEPAAPVMPVAEPVAPVMPEPVQPAAQQLHPQMQQSPVPPVPPQPQPRPVPPVPPQPQPGIVPPVPPQPQPGIVPPVPPQPQQNPIPPANPRTPAPEKKKKSGGKAVVAIILLLLGLGALGVGGYFLYQELWATEPQQPTAPTASSAATEATTVPTETPTTAAPTEGTTEPVETTQATEPQPDYVVPQDLMNQWVGNFDMISIYPHTATQEVIIDFQKYNYASQTWESRMGTIYEAENETMSVQFHAGDRKHYTFRIDGDQLILDGSCYTVAENADDAALASYRESGTPLRGNVYYGMTKDEVRKFADTAYGHDGGEGKDYYYALPNIVPDQMGGTMLYNFDDETQDPEKKDRLIEVKLSFNTDTSDTAKTEALAKALLEIYTQQYGKCEESRWNGGTAVSYTWKIKGSNVVIQMINWNDDMGITISHTVDLA